MKIVIYWNSIPFVEIEKKNNHYFTNINSKNAIDAKNNGLPLFLFSNEPSISSKLPRFVKQRIPDPNTRNKYLTTISEDEEANDLEYIKITKCRLATDKITIDVV